MFEEIKRKYLDFHDAKVSEIKISNCNFIHNIELIIDCENSQKDYGSSFEKIKLFFTDIIYFNINYEKNIDFVVFETLITNENELVIFDFDCDSIGENLLKENPNSRFIIKCKEVSYEVLLE
jgi:hypothetical protein